MTVRPRVVVVAALTCLLGLTACVGAHRVTDDAALPGAVTAVRLDSGDGGVTVEGRPGAPGASVHREITYGDGQPAPGPTAHLDGGTLVLDGCGPDCSVTYTVIVPSGLPVTGTTSNGDVALRDVGGVDVGTTNGALALDRVAGDVRARTVNGEIRGHDLRGTRSEADTSNGGVDLAPAVPQDVRVVTTNGTVAVALPGAGYRVDVATQNGGRSVSVPTDPAGPHSVDVRTTNGSVTVDPS